MSNMIPQQQGPPGLGEPPAPDLSALLGGAGQDFGPPTQGPPEQAPPEQDHEAMIRELLDMARQVASAADDDEEALDFEKVTSLIQGILAKQQKQRTSLLKGANDPAALARVLGG